MNKKLTKRQVEEIVRVINQLEVGNVATILLNGFESAYFAKGLEETKLIYKSYCLVSIDHKFTNVVVTVKSSPYVGVFSYIEPLIIRLLYARVEHISGRVIV